MPEMRTAYYSPAPYPADERQRQRVVDRLLRCDLSGASLAHLVREAAGLFDVPISAVTVLDGDRQWLAVRAGIEASTTNRSAAFCGYTIADAAPFCVSDTLQDPRFAGNPLVVGQPNIRFYAGARIIVEGMPVGALCAIGTKPVDDIDKGKCEQLHALAEKVSHLLRDLVERGEATGSAYAADPRIVPFAGRKPEHV